MTQADLARLCDLLRGVSLLVLGALGVAGYLLVRPVVRLVRGRGVATVRARRASLYATPRRTHRDAGWPALQQR